MVYFIQPAVLERLMTGTFVAMRKQAKSYPMRDRRNALSPLNITRRAIRYEPLVFSNRRDEIIAFAQALNDPQQKLLLLSGPSGRGKTCFIRGVIELMGGGSEQLVWFDVSRHTDYDEVVRYLVDTMTYVCQGALTHPPHSENPVDTLAELLRHAADCPILIVIDNLEHLITPDERFRSREIREALHFLMTFPNIRLILSGKRLPLAEMRPNTNGIRHLALPPLTDPQAEALIKAHLREPSLQQQSFSSLLPFFQGEPYLLSIFARLFEQQPDIQAWLTQFKSSTSSPENILLSVYQTRLPPAEQHILFLLALVRHGVTPAVLHAMAAYCQFEWTGLDFQKLDQTMLRWVLKKVYPPQLVLTKLRHRLTEGHEQEHIEAYYQLFDQVQAWAVDQVPETSLGPIHDGLCRFYAAEREKHMLARTYQTRTRHLAAESQYHFNRAKKHQQQRLIKSASALPNPALSQPLDDASNTLGAEQPVSNPAITEPPTPRGMMGIPAALSWDSAESAISPHISQNPDAAFAPTHPLHDSPETAMAELVMPPIVSLSDADLIKLADLISLSAAQAPSLPRHAVSQWHDEIDAQPPRLTPPTLLPSTHAAQDQPGFPAPANTDPVEKAVLQEIEAAITRHHRVEIAQGLMKLAIHRFQKGHAENAEHCLLKALEFAKTEQDASLQGQLHSMLGHYYQSHYQHNQALSHLHELIRLADKHPDILSIAQRIAAYQDMTEIYFYRQDLDQALSLSKQCLALLPNQHPRTAELLFQMALHLDEAGRFQEAIPYYKQSFDISASLQEHDACANILYNLASLYYDQGMLTEAEATLKQSLTYESRQSMAMEQFDSMMLLSKIQEAQQKLPQAWKAAKQAYALAKSSLDETHVAAACLRLGHLAECMSDWQGAKSLYQEAEQVAESALSAESRNLIHQKRLLAEEHLAS